MEDCRIPNCVMKLVVLGDSNVGKSSLLVRYTKRHYESYHPPTIGASFLTKTVTIKGETGERPCRLEIWDTAGQEKYKAIAPMYYKGAKIAIVCYDITGIESYLSAQRWVDDLLKYTTLQETGIVVLCGTKKDLEAERTVPREDVEQYAFEMGFLCIETSSKTGEHVDELFDRIIERIPEMINKLVSDRDVLRLSQKSGDGAASGCCYV